MGRRWNDDEYVCADCFSDDGLKDFIAGYAESRECSFCGASADEPIAAPMRDVIDHVARCIGQHYDDPANTLPYESAEGGYQGTTYTTDEVFDEVGLEFPNDSDGSLHDAICDGLENDLWSDADPFGLSPGEQLHFSWDEFCRVIKHERRYFFVQSNGYRGSELFSPAEILRLIFSYAEGEGAFVTVPRGTRVFRARHQPSGYSFASAGTLGPPPVEHAIQTNRMSPPGVVMMYAADDKVTALAETATKAGHYAVGEFVIEREILILDLTRLPPVPSIFAELPDSLEYDPRPRLGFLHRITSELSRPIARDDRVHIEYVPTQVVTEYVRTAVTIESRQVDGIRYKSSRCGVGTALVLFASQDNLVLEESEQPQFYFLHKDLWLRLSNVSVETVTGREISSWTSRSSGAFC
jgi:hypothetical protein